MLENTTRGVDTQTEMSDDSHEAKAQKKVFLSRHMEMLAE